MIDELKTHHSMVLAMKTADHLKAAHNLDDHAHWYLYCLLREDIEGCVKRAVNMAELIDRKAKDE